MAEKYQVEENVMAQMMSVYNETVIDHILNPRNADALSSYDGLASITDSCGDTMEMRIKVKDKVITNISFWTEGCAASIASASMATALVKGKTVAETLRVSKQDVLNALGGLPEQNEHCASQAVATIKEAVRDYLSCAREPWKRAYRSHGQ